MAQMCNSRAKGKVAELCGACNHGSGLREGDLSVMDNNGIVRNG